MARSKLLKQTLDKIAIPSVTSAFLCGCAFASSLDNTHTIILIGKILFVWDIKKAFNNQHR